MLRGECQSLEMADSFFCWRKNSPAAVLGRFDHASTVSILPMIIYNQQ